MDMLKTGFDQLRRYLTPWVLLGGVLIAFLMLGVTLLVIFAARPSPAPKGLPTAALYVIPAPTDTLPVPTTVTQPTPTPTSEVPPPPPAGVIVIGSFVQVTGTGAVGLRLHDDPSLNSNTQFLGMDTEVFKVTDGPRQADGYSWWYLVAPYDPARKGWAVANYLTAIANP
jgi:hypothetical protein